MPNVKQHTRKMAPAIRKNLKMKIDDLAYLLRKDMEMDYATESGRVVSHTPYVKEPEADKALELIEKAEVGYLQAGDPAYPGVKKISKAQAQKLLQKAYDSL